MLLCLLLCVTNRFVSQSIADLEFHPLCPQDQVLQEIDTQLTVSAAKAEAADAQLLAVQGDIEAAQVQQGLTPPNTQCETTNAESDRQIQRPVEDCSRRVVVSRWQAFVPLSLCQLHIAVLEMRKSHGATSGPNVAPLSRQRYGPTNLAYMGQGSSKQGFAQLWHSEVQDT